MSDDKNIQPPGDIPKNDASNKATEGTDPDASTNLARLHAGIDATEKQIAAIIESFIELGVSVYDFPGTPEATKGMITNLKRNVDRILKLNTESNDPKSVLRQVDIPFEVFQYIEDGREPRYLH